MLSVFRGALMVVTLICWGMSLYKISDLARDPRNRPLRALVLSLIAVTLSMTIQPLMPQIDQTAGVLDLARLTSNCLSLLSVTAGQASQLFLMSTDMKIRRQVRRRWTALWMTITAMVVLFILTPPAGDLSDPRVRSGEYYGDPFAGPFLYPYLALLGWSVVQVAVLAIRYVRIAQRPLTRFGLRLVAIGALWMAAYVAAKLVAVVVGTLAPTAALAIEAVVLTCLTVAIFLLLIGATIPSWGPRVGLDRLWSWASAVGDCYRLLPLWSAIYGVVPEIALVPVSRGWLGTVLLAREATLRRVRFTYEILDGYAVLRPWMSRQVFTQAQRAARAEGLTGDRARAVTEAAIIAAALDGRRRDLPPGGDPQGVPPVPMAPQRDGTDPGSGIAADHVAWLIQVARAYRSSIVSSILSPRSAPAAVATTPASRRSTG